MKSVKALFTLLENFEKCSELKVNQRKTEAMRLGASRNDNASPLGLKWKKCVKALGIYYTYDNKELDQKNFFDKLASVEKEINLWKWRGLSLYGKVTIIKSFLFSKCLYAASLLCVPEKFICSLNQSIYSFLWNGKDKVRRLAVINNIENGGLKLTDFETSIKSLRLVWITRALNDNPAPWKAYLENLLRDFEGLFFLNCNYNIKDFKTDSQFYVETLKWWYDFRENFARDLLGTGILWNNRLIKVSGKSIYYHNFVKAGITFCHDLHFEKGLFDSFEYAVSKGLVKSNWLQWMGLQKAIPAKLISSTQPKERNTTFKIGDKIHDVTKCRCKTFYSLLIETKAIPSNGFQKVKTDFNLEDDDVKEVFLAFQNSRHRNLYQ